MKLLSKSNVYLELFKIQEEQEINVNRYIKELAGKSEIPYDILVFINKHSPLQQLETYNHIYNNRRKNPLYKNLVNEELSQEDKAVSISSLITQVLIRMKSMNEEDRKEFSEIMNMDLLVEALKGYSNNDNDGLNECCINVRSILKKLYSKED